jgi:hypothetical protein
MIYFVDCQIEYTYLLSSSRAIYILLANDVIVVCCSSLYKIADPPIWRFTRLEIRNLKLAFHSTAVGGEPFDYRGRAYIESSV